MKYKLLWDNACSHLKKVINPNMYSRWIEIIEPYSFSDGIFTVKVDNDFFKTWITDNYASLILDALKIAGVDDDLSLSIIVESQKNIEQDLEEKTRQKQVYTKHKRRVSKITGNLNPNFTFENFVTGPSNNWAHGAALGVSQSPGYAYNPLFIYGKTGIGKTHLMQAIGHRILKSPDMLVSYVSSEALLNEYVESLKTHTTIQFRNKYRKTDVLLVDDIQFLASKEALQDEFFHTFNVLYNAHKQIIMTSDLPPRELSGLEPRLVSRFEWGLVTEIESPDFETRLAILQYKLSLTNIKIPDEIIFFLADNIKSNVRSLEGALTRVSSFASLNNQVTLDISIIRTLLKDMLTEECKKELTAEEIKRAVTEFFDLRMSDMTSSKRPRSVSGPRQIAMYLCRKLTSLSLLDIAAAFDKTHSNIMHACTTVQDRIQLEENVRLQVYEITRKLGKDPNSL